MVTRQINPLVHALLVVCLITWSPVMADDDYYNHFSVCSDSVIIVEELMIVCDSPGSYYYGSNKYRNSAKCAAGDKGKLQFVFEITDDLQASPYLSLDVQAYGSVPNNQIYSNVDLCSLETLTSQDGSICPAAGVYSVSEKFYFGNKQEDYDYQFKPVPVIGFTSNVEQNYYDLGGANTQACKGGTFQNWSTNMGNTASKTLRLFLVTFGILFAVSMTFIAWRYFAMKRELKVGPKREEMEEELLDDEDLRRIAMMSREKDLIDA